MFAYFLLFAASCLSLRYGDVVRFRHATSPTVLYLHKLPTLIQSLRAFRRASDELSGGAKRWPAGELRDQARFSFALRRLGAS